MDLRAALEHVEASGPSEADAAAAVAFGVSLSLPLDEAALAGPVRRALLLLATGGDPHRALDVDGRAVRALADELEALVGDDELAAAFGFVHARARGLPRIEAAAAGLAADPGRARSAVALALLGAELADDAPDPPALSRRPSSEGTWRSVPHVGEAARPLRADDPLVTCGTAARALCGRKWRRNGSYSWKRVPGGETQRALGYREPGRRAPLERPLGNGQPRR